jgi:hypothetical protein
VVRCRHPPGFSPPAQAYSTRAYKSCSRFAVCINNTEHPASIELYKIYRVLPDEEATKDGDLRLIDESSEDYPYPADLFVLIEVPKAVQRALLQTS